MSILPFFIRAGQGLAGNKSALSGRKALITAPLFSEPTEPEIGERWACQMMAVNESIFGENWRLDWREGLFFRWRGMNGQKCYSIFPTVGVRVPVIEGMTMAQAQTAIKRWNASVHNGKPLTGANLSEAVASVFRGWNGYLTQEGMDLWDRVEDLDLAACSRDQVRQADSLPRLDRI